MNFKGVYMNCISSRPSGLASHQVKLETRFDLLLLGALFRSLFFVLIESQLSLEAHEDLVSQNAKQQSHYYSLDLESNWITFDDFPVTWLDTIVDYFPTTNAKFDDCSGATKKK